MAASALNAPQQTPQVSPRAKSPFEVVFETKHLPWMRANRLQLIAVGDLELKAVHWHYGRPLVVIDRAAKVNGMFSAMNLVQNIVLNAMRALAQNQLAALERDIKRHRLEKTLDARSLQTLVHRFERMRDSFYRHDYIVIASRQDLLTFLRRDTVTLIRWDLQKVKRTIQALIDKHLVQRVDDSFKVVPQRAAVVKGPENRKKTIYRLPPWEEVQRYWFESGEYAVTERPGPGVPRCVWTYGPGMRLVRTHNARAYSIPVTPAVEMDYTPAKPPVAAIVRQSATASSPRPRPIFQPEPPPEIPKVYEEAPSYGPLDGPIDDSAFLPSQQVLDEFSKTYLGNTIDQQLPKVLIEVRREAWKFGEELDDKDLLWLGENAFIKAKRTHESVGPRYFRKTMISDLRDFFKRRKREKAASAARDAKAREDRKEQVREAIRSNDSAWIRDLARICPDEAREVMEEMRQHAKT
jgi:hypothetical protein